MNRTSGTRRMAIYLVVFIALAAALAYGKTRAAPDLTPSIEKIFPAATTVEPTRGIYSVFDDAGELLGWAASAKATGYGGPLLLVVGIDRKGEVAGIEVVEHRETPIFFRMVRSDAYFEDVSGSDFQEIEYDYESVVGVTGATRTSDAIVAGLRGAVAEVAGERFDVRLPAPPRSFEFGLLEIVVLALFVAGIAANRAGGSVRRWVRWACQLTGLLVIGFWAASPISLAKITSLISGYFPDLYSNLAFYLLIVGFAITTLLYRRNIYCLYICPFGAAQRCVGVIGGMNMKLSAHVGRFLETARNVVVFAAIFAAFITLQPALASYEPFAALFALTGSTLQWLLLFVVLTLSLVVRTPWCSFLCPMRSIEIVLRNLGAWGRGVLPGRRQRAHE